MDDVEVGKITRHWSGFCAQICAWADTFSIKFPSNADIPTKALLIGACFLIVSGKRKRFEFHFHLVQLLGF